MRSVTLWRLIQRYINKTCIAIIAAELKLRHFKKVTRCSDWFKIRLICVSYHLCGKGPLWLAKTWITGLITSLIYENTRIHAFRRRRPVGPGILLIFVLITPEPPALVFVHTFVCVYIFYDQYNKAGIPDNSGPLSFHFYVSESLLFGHKVTWGLPTHRV